MRQSLGDSAEAGQPRRLKRRKLTNRWKNVVFDEEDLLDIDAEIN